MKACGWLWPPFACIWQFRRRQFSRRFFLLSALLPNLVFAQPPAKNLQIILPLFDRLASRVGAELALAEPRAVWLQPPANAKPEERFLSSRLVTVLKDSLRLAIFAEPVAALRMTAITPQLSRCEIVYRKLPRRRFWQKAHWQRAAHVVVEVSALNPATRQIDFQKIFSESLVDTVEGKFLSRLEDTSLPFTIGRKEEIAGGPGWLEPVLITSATGAVVYLFYSLRSR